MIRSDSRTKKKMYVSILLTVLKMLHYLIYASVGHHGKENESLWRKVSHLSLVQRRQLPKENCGGVACAISRRGKSCRWSWMWWPWNFSGLLLLLLPPPLIGDCFPALSLPWQEEQKEPATEATLRLALRSASLAAFERGCVCAAPQISSSTPTQLLIERFIISRYQQVTIRHHRSRDTCV